MPKVQLILFVIKKFKCRGSDNTKLPPGCQLTCIFPSSLCTISEPYQTSGAYGMTLQWRETNHPTSLCHTAGLLFSFFSWHMHDTKHKNSNIKLHNFNRLIK